MKEVALASTCSPTEQPARRHTQARTRVHRARTNLALVHPEDLVEHAVELEHGQNATPGLILDKIVVVFAAHRDLRHPFLLIHLRAPLGVEPNVRA